MLRRNTASSVDRVYLFFWGCLDVSNPKIQKRVAVAGSFRALGCKFLEDMKGYEGYGGYMKVYP